MRLCISMLLVVMLHAAAIVSAFGVERDLKLQYTVPCEIELLLSAGNDLPHWSDLLPDSWQERLAAHSTSVSSARAQKLLDRVRELVPKLDLLYMSYFAGGAQLSEVDNLPSVVRFWALLAQSADIFPAKVAAVLTEQLDDVVQQPLVRLGEARKLLTLVHDQLTHARTPIEVRYRFLAHLYTGIIDGFTASYASRVERPEDIYLGLVLDPAKQIRARTAIAQLERALEVGRADIGPLGTAFVELVLAKQLLRASDSYSRRADRHFLLKPEFVWISNPALSDLNYARQLLRSVIEACLKFIEHPHRFGLAHTLYMEAKDVELSVFCDRLSGVAARHPLDARSNARLLSQVLTWGSDDWIAQEVRQRSGLIRRVVGRLKQEYRDNSIVCGKLDLIDGYAWNRQFVSELVEKLFGVDDNDRGAVWPKP